MRHLSSKQKKMIENHIKIYGLTFINALVRDCEKLNDYETLWCDVQRYAEDYYSKLEDKRINEHCYTSPDFQM